MKKTWIYLFTIILLSSCATHQRSNIKAEEEFIVELKQASTRGGMLETALQGLFLGASYLAEKSAKSLTSSYSQSISINNYYNTDLGTVEKTYNEIHVKKYSKPSENEDKQRLTSIVTSDVNNLPKSRGESGALSIDDVIRVESDDLLNFHAVIEIMSHPENPGVSRLSFNSLRVFFSKTKVFTDEDLNAKVSVSIEGQWRNTNGSPMKATLIEQEYDFKNLKYGADNQIEEPILSPWYYDIPIYSDIEDVSNYGVLKVNVQLEEYEGNKSKYINKLPSILSDNKNSIIKNGASTIQKITN
jgi:hypothetical protein